MLSSLSSYFNMLLGYLLGISSHLLTLGSYNTTAWKSVKWKAVIEATSHRMFCTVKAENLWCLYDKPLVLSWSKRFFLSASSSVIKRRANYIQSTNNIGEKELSRPCWVWKVLLWLTKQLITKSSELLELRPGFQIMHSLWCSRTKIHPLQVCPVHGIDPLNWLVRGVFTVT